MYEVLSQVTTARHLYSFNQLLLKKQMQYLIWGWWQDSVTESSNDIIQRMLTASSYPSISIYSKRFFTLILSDFALGYKVITWLPWLQTSYFISRVMKSATLIGSLLSTTRILIWIENKSINNRASNRTFKATNIFNLSTEGEVFNRIKQIGLLILSPCSATLFCALN